MKKLSDYIYTFNEVLDADDYFKLLYLVENYDFGNISSPSGSIYDLEGSRYNKKLSSDDGEIFDLIHKAFVNTLPQMYDAFSPLIPTDLRYNKYSGYWLCKYPEGGYLSYHTDSDADAASVTASFAINCNYEGGDMIFWDDFILEKERNSIHVYPSSLTYPHRVDKVTKGIRYSVVVWFAYQKGDDWRE
ncbi:2OG-Fe(II) oxygenase, partial [archaeon]|nr:2OG-Fe(II) oxygenase [archaeon]